MVGINAASSHAMYRTLKNKKVNQQLLSSLPSSALFILIAFALSSAEPIVLNGAMVPELVGAKIGALRVVNANGEAIPFQIDEITEGGEYVCPQGQSPNADSGNGVLDRQDEIVFLSEDADARDVSPGVKPSGLLKGKRAKVTVRRGAEIRTVHIVNDEHLPRSMQCYLFYDHSGQFLRTPYYYAQFAKDRFHFLRAGCMDFTTGKFTDLTNELRVEIRFRTLWGLLPIRFTEDNIVCKVKRYKAGPVRLIRRGDFHLELGLGIKGSKAIVYQLCYPQLVKVPVRAYLPVRLGIFFSEAFIEMTPVIRKNAAGFRFIVPSIGFSGDLSGSGSVDTLVNAIPKKGYVVTDGQKGFEWITSLAADDGKLSGSGYIFRIPSKRNGAAECGFRLTVNDLPKGSYDIVNWVFFSKHSPVSAGTGLKTILEPAVIGVSSGTFSNLLVAPPPAAKRGK